MLNTISWQQYTTAVVLLCAAWYAYVGLRYFQPEITAFLKVKPKSVTSTPPVTNQMNVVLGEAKPEADTGLFSADELIFSTSQPDDISDETVPKGPGDELLAEAQVLVTAYEANDNKTEFLSLLNLLIDRYEVFRDEISLPKVIDSIKPFAQTRLPFSLKETEWPLNF